MWWKIFHSQPTFVYCIVDFTERSVSWSTGPSTCEKGSDTPINISLILTQNAPILIFESGLGGFLWLLKLQMSFVFPHKATCAIFVPKTNVNVAEINKFKSSVSVLLSQCFDLYQNNYSPHCWLLAIKIHHHYTTVNNGLLISQYFSLVLIESI